MWAHEDAESVEHNSEHDPAGMADQVDGIILTISNPF